LTGHRLASRQARKRNFLSFLFLTPTTETHIHIMPIQYIRTRAQLHARFRSYVAVATHLLATPPNLFEAEASRYGLRPGADGGMHASASLWLNEPDLDSYSSAVLQVFRSVPKDAPGLEPRGYKQGVAFVGMAASDYGWAWFSLKRAPKFEWLPKPEMAVITDAYRQAMLRARRQAGRQARRKPQPFFRRPRWIAKAARRVLFRR
jgi:hypothetical protein